MCTFLCFTLLYTVMMPAFKAFFEREDGTIHGDHYVTRRRGG